MIKGKDEILINSLLRGEREAQRELYESHSAYLMAIAMRYLGERNTAEDLLHDSFIKIFSSIKGFRYRGEGSLRAWMSRIVVNGALERLRREGRNRIIPLDNLSTERLASEPPPVEKIPREVLLKFIAELPDGYRTVFNLFCIEEYSHREIAHELGINEKSSSSQLLRAKRILATKIKRYIESHE